MSVGRREVAHRLFAAEYDDATLEYSESDEERAPNYVVTPTGARVNRLFFVGVLTEVEQVSDDVLRARVADPTGAFVIYAGQYQPEAMAFLEGADPPAFVAVTGKARTFSPEDSDRVLTSVRPETINAVDADTRDRWTVGAAEHTLGRVATFAAALRLDRRGEALADALRAAGASEALVAGIPRALEHYGTTEGYLAAVRDLALAALRQVAGEVEEVPPLAADPDDPGGETVDPGELADAVDAPVVGRLMSGEVPAGGSGAPADAEAGDAAETVAAAGDGAERASGSGPAAGDPVETADAGETAAATTGTGTEEPAGPADSTDSAGESDESDAGGPAAGSDGGATAPGGSAADAADGESTETPATDAADGESTETPATDAADGESTDTPTTDAGGAAETEEIGDFEPGGGGDTADAGEESGDGLDEEEPRDVLDEEERERIEREYGTDFSTGTEVPEPGESDIEPEAGPIDPDEGATAEETESGSAGGPATEPEEPRAETAGPEPGETEAETAELGEAAGTDGVQETAEEAAAEGTVEDEAAGGTTAEEEATEEPAAEEDDAGETAAEEPATEEDAAGAETAEDVDLEAAVLAAMEELDDGDGADQEAVVASVVDDHGADPGEVESAIQDALMGGKCYEPDDGLVKPI